MNVFECAQNFEGNIVKSSRHRMTLNYYNKKKKIKMNVYTDKRKNL